METCSALTITYTLHSSKPHLQSTFRLPSIFSLPPRKQGCPTQGPDVNCLARRPLPALTPWHNPLSNKPSSAHLHLAAAIDTSGPSIALTALTSRHVHAADCFVGLSYCSRTRRVSFICLRQRRHELLLILLGLRQRRWSQTRYYQTPETEVR